MTSSSTVCLAHAIHSCSQHCCPKGCCPPEQPIPAWLWLELQVEGQECYGWVTAIFSIFLNQNTCKLLKIYLVFSFEGSYNAVLSLRFRPTVTASPLKPLQNELMIAVLTTVPCHLHEPVWAEWANTPSNTVHKMYSSLTAKNGQTPSVKEI